MISQNHLAGVDRQSLVHLGNKLRHRQVKAPDVVGGCPQNRAEVEEPLPRLDVNLQSERFSLCDDSLRHQHQLGVAATSTNPNISKPRAATTRWKTTRSP